MVHPDNLAAVRLEVESLRQEFAGAGELRSKNLAKKHERLLKTVSALARMQFKIAVLVVDKNALLATKGLRYRASFVKYLHGLLYGRLFRTYQELHVRADEFGRDEFMTAFIKYVDDNHLRDLFSSQSFGFVDSKSEVLVQVADLVAGSFGRVFDGCWSQAQREMVLAAWSPCVLAVDKWPPRYLKLPASTPTGAGDELDAKLSRSAAEHAVAFLEKHQGSSRPERVAQVVVLEKLLFESRYENPRAYTASGVLLEHLAERGITDINQNSLRSTVISELRDAGVLIASSSHGYKIPTCVSDLRDFVARMGALVEPVLGRVSRARDEIRLLSDGRVELLEGHDLLRLAVEQVPRVD